MDRHLFNLKFAAKEMARNSRKCDKVQRVEKDKCKRALRQGNIGVAKIHAENTIRQKNQAITFLNMSARLDAVASKVEYANTMHRVSRSMLGVTKAMDAALKSMNLEKISVLMDKFEQECVELDLHTATIDTSMQQTVTDLAPQNEIEQLMQQIAEEAGLELSLEMPSAQDTLPSSVQEGANNKDELEKRLMILRKTGFKKF